MQMYQKQQKSHKNTHSHFKLCSLSIYFPFSAHCEGQFVFALTVESRVSMILDFYTSNFVAPLTRALQLFKTDKKYLNF